MRERLLTALKRLWPEYRWTPVDIGRERNYSAEAGPFLLMVEWSNASSTVTLKRDFGGELDVSVVGASTGMTAEGIRRAYLEALVSWHTLVAPPPTPTRESAVEVESDHDFFARFFRNLRD